MTAHSALTVGRTPGPQPTPPSACLAYMKLISLAKSGSRGTLADLGVCPGSAPRHSRFHANCPFTTVATGPPRNVRPWNGEFRLREKDWFTS